jgi:hypothetical protein
MLRLSKKEQKALSFNHVPFIKKGTKCSAMTHDISKHQNHVPFFKKGTESSVT